MPRSDKSKRDDMPVKIERAIWQQAKVICASRGIPMAELLSDLLRPIIEREYHKTLKKLQAGESPHGHGAGGEG
jgi:hypothetical protein